MGVNINWRRSRDGQRQTAYLTFTEGGKRERINTRITAPTKPKTAFEKLQTKEAIRAAEAAKAKMELQLLEGRTGQATSERRKADFCSLIGQLLEEDKKRLAEGTTRYRAVMVMYFNRVYPNGVRVEELTADTFHRFGDWVRTNTRSKEATILQYYVVMGGYMKRLRRAGYPVPHIEIDRPKIQPKKRTFLSADELEEFKQNFKPKMGRDLNPTDIMEVRRMFLFSCYTGLRYSDMQTAKYSDIERLAEGRFIIRVKQQKTGGEVAVPLIEEAIALLDMAKCGNDTHLFCTIDVQRADGFLKRHRPIKGKHISMHIARHTFAVTLLDRGADIYAVSRLLGHTNVKTTQIYADITAGRLRDTIELLTINK